MHASMPLQPGSIDTPNPVTVFQSTLPAAAVVLSNQVTKPAHIRASSMVQGNTTCCCTTPSMLTPNSVNCSARKVRKKRAMGNSNPKG